MRTRPGNGNGATERQYGHGIRKRVRMNGNETLETRHYAPTTRLPHWNDVIVTACISLVLA